MFASRVSKEAANRRVEKNPAKVVEVSNFSARPLRVPGDQSQCSVNNNLIVLGISLSQPYSHGLYVGQMFEALKEKIDQTSEKVLGDRCIASNWHLIVLLSTAYDPANNPSFDIENTTSQGSLQAKELAKEHAAQWVSQHAPTLDEYSHSFDYTIVYGDTFEEDDDYQTILRAFNDAYTQGKAQGAGVTQKKTYSLKSIDSGKKLNDRSFYNLMRKVVDSYVQRNSFPSTTKAEKKSLVARSEWIVLREYALMFMLSLGKVPRCFGISFSMTEIDHAYFSYPFGNFGKEVIHLLRNLFANDSLGLHNMGLYNIRLDDFCSNKNTLLKDTESIFAVCEDDTHHMNPSPLTEENLLAHQRMLKMQEDYFISLPEKERTSYLQGLVGFFNKHNSPFTPIRDPNRSIFRPTTTACKSGSGTPAKAARTVLIGSFSSGFSASCLGNNVPETHGKTAADTCSS